jgi:hypothetical protein
MPSGTLRRNTHRAKAHGRQAARSRPLHALARAGFVARGVMYILIGGIALQIAFGHAATTADNRGALLEVGSTAAGSVALWLLGIGFAGLALWRLTQVIYGGPGAEGKKLTARLLALGKAAVYGFLAFGTLRYAVGSGAPKSSDRQSVDLSAKLMSYPGGQVVVVIAGLVLVGAGGYLAWAALRRKFLADLETGQMTVRQRQFAVWTGRIGGTARGIVFAGAGVFLIIAGAQHNPGKAKGLDSTLRSFAHLPIGPFFLVVIAIGLVIFGGYSAFIESRWRRV